MRHARRSSRAGGAWGPASRSSRARSPHSASASTRIAVANGSAALHIALLAVGCGPGDEVVLPSLNFVAAGNSIVHTGAAPVFCDIRGERDLNLDVDDLESALGERTRAVVALHYGGYPCEIDRLVESCHAEGVAVV